MHRVVVENLGGNSYPLARWPWHRSCIRYPKVTKRSADEHADYRVNVCIPGERLHFTHIFSRLLVHLTFFFVYLDIKQKEKGIAILSSLNLFFETAGILHPERRQISLPCQGWRWGREGYASSLMAIMTRTNALSSSNCYLLDPLIRLLLLHLRSLGIGFCIRACVM